MTSISSYPSIIIGCEYGSQTTFWSSFTSKHVGNYHFPQFWFRNLNFSTKISRNVCLKATNHANGSDRPLIEYSPSPWNDHFLSVRVEEWEIDALSKEIEALKPNVRDLLMSSRNVKERIRLIYLLDTLCLSYHFEEDIEAILKQAFKDIEDKIADEDDLYTISIIFQVFRLHGHKMSCDVFNRFKGADGKFKQYLIRDIKGMLSLYEVAHLGTTTEDVMEEALSFTRNHLESLAHQANPHLSTLIKDAQYRPRHYNAEILVARKYISFYEQEDDHDEILLKFAKLNFNYLQLHYIRELNIVTKWWKDLDIAAKLPYMRNRMVELYFWTTILYYEPQFSLGRITTAKSYALFTAVDDTCDAFATLEEVKALVGNLERMDTDGIDKLPDYLKFVFKFVLDVFEELEQQMRREGKSNYMQHLRKQFRRIVKAYLQISKWARNQKVPAFEEYMEVGKVTGGASVSIAPSLMSMGPISGRETYEWLETDPKLIKALGMKGRLTNDLTTFKDEMSRGEVATGINCYMKEYRVTEEEALAEFRARLHEVNKVVNEEFFNTNIVPRKILQVALNWGRILDVSYTYGDEFTHPEGKMKENIDSLFMEPILL